jgi:transposase-like protein
MQAMTKTFRQALLDALERTGANLSDVARGASVSYEQLKKVTQRATASTNVDDARAVANYFGLTVDEFMDDSLAEDRLRLAQLWSRLSEKERQILLAAARGLPDQAPAEGK